MIQYVIGMVASVIISVLDWTKQFHGTKKLSRLTDILFIYLLVLSAFRDYSVGADLFRYINRYEIVGESRLSMISDLHNRWGFEYGYLLFSKLIFRINSNPRFFVLVTSSIILCSLYWFIKKYSKLPALSIYFLNLFLIYETSFNLIRIFMAVAICCVAIDQIIKEKKLLFVACVLIAFSFHSSALVFLLVLPLQKVKLSVKHIALTLVSGCIIFFAARNVLEIVFSYFTIYKDRYFNKIGTGSGGGMLLMLTSIFIYCFMHRQLVEIYDEHYNLWLNMLLVMLVLNIFAFQLEIAARVMWYYKICLLTLIPNTSVVRQKNAYAMNLAFGFGCVVLPLFYFVRMMTTDTAQVVPYIFSIN